MCILVLKNVQSRYSEIDVNYNTMLIVLAVAIGGGIIAVVIIVGVLCVINSHTRLKWKANIEQIRAVARNAAVPNQYYELER